ncbi:hypothetical protein ACWC5I_30675, partial [Kitasatospora sp. NPDC001574]
MARGSEPARPDYKPELGELVRDMLHGAVIGAYMGTEDGKVFLRRPDGGIEWTTYPSEIAPVDSASAVR